MPKHILCRQGAVVDRRLDRLDIKLLNLVQQDNLRTADSLAHDIPLSPSAITRRLRQLRSEGVIVRDMALLSPDAVERLRAIVRVQLEKHASDGGLKALREVLAANRHVQSCFEVAGSFDLVLIVAARNMAEFNEITDALLARDPVVRRYETEFIRREMKEGSIYWLEEEDFT
jgi:Lrp/AsnC family transcriptional regulator, leucine-responsive regulatory protein